MLLSRSGRSSRLGVVPDPGEVADEEEVALELDRVLEMEMVCVLLRLVLGVGVEFGRVGVPPSEEALRSGPITRKSA